MSATHDNMASREASAPKRWRQIVGLVAAALTCLFGVGAADAISVFEDSGERPEQLLGDSDSSRSLDSAGVESLSAEEDARVLTAAPGATPLDSLSDPTVLATSRTQAAGGLPVTVHGPPLYRIAPSHSPPLV